MKEVKNMQKGACITYWINGILFLISLVVGFSSVKENLDGMHGYDGSAVLLFAVICIAFSISCIYSAISISKKSKLGFSAFVISPIIITFIIISRIFVSTLTGNIDTDLQYLLLRTFQGFDSTYLFVAIDTIISIAICIIQRYKVKDKVSK